MSPYPGNGLGIMAKAPARVQTRPRLYRLRTCLYTAGMAMTPPDPRRRPIFLELSRIHFPVGAIASILHRITGAMLVIGVPAGLALAEYSSRSAAHFRWVAGLLETPWAAGLGALALAGLVHHLVAGVRVLLMDMGAGVGPPQARRSAWGSLTAAALAGLIGLILLWPGGEGGHGV